jgi:putative FmdB family regulatory protein
MPTYVYECLLDGSRFEKNVPISERDGNIECPECNKFFTERKIAFTGLTWAPTAGGMR